MTKDWDEPVNWQTIHESMASYGIDLLVGTSPENIFYATGFTTFQGVWNRFPKAVVVSAHERRAIAVLSVAEAGAVVDHSWPEGTEALLCGTPNVVIPNSEATFLDDERHIATVVRMPEKGLLTGVLSALKRLGLGKRVAVDQSGAPELYFALRDLAEDQEVHPGGEDIWRLARMVKTPQEVAHLQAAIDVNERAFDAVWAALGTVPETELLAIYRDVVSTAGGNLQHWVGGAGRKAGTYRGPRPVVPARGERFRLDAGFELGGWCTDLGGTAQVGAEPSTDERRTYDALTAGIDEGLRVARPGLKTSALYEAVIGGVRRGGHRDYRCTLAGHGIGVEPRDYPIIAPPMASRSPFLGPSFDPELRPGMVLNIETPLNLLTEGAFQHEITLLVEEDGARRLSRRRTYDAVWPTGPNATNLQGRDA